MPSLLIFIMSENHDRGDGPTEHLSKIIYNVTWDHNFWYLTWNELILNGCLLNRLKRSQKVENGMQRTYKEIFLLNWKTMIQMSYSYL